MSNPDQPGNATPGKQSTGKKPNSSVRGTFTYTLLTLQERLSHIPDYEQSLVIPTIEQISFYIENDFWRGTITDEHTRRLSCSAYAPYRAASRIMLHMHVHSAQLGLNKRIANQVELSLADILELAKIAYGPARVAFTLEEQRHIRNRLQHLFGNSYEVRSLDTVETKVVQHLLDHEKRVPAT